MREKESNSKCSRQTHRRHTCARRKKKQNAAKHPPLSLPCFAHTLPVLLHSNTFTQTYSLYFQFRSVVTREELQRRRADTAATGAATPFDAAVVVRCRCVWLLPGCCCGGVFCGCRRCDGSERGFDSDAGVVCSRRNQKMSRVWRKIGGALEENSEERWQQQAEQAAMQKREKRGGKGAVERRGAQKTQRASGE